jgi:hypothetical protein
MTLIIPGDDLRKPFGILVEGRGEGVRRYNSSASQSPI